MRRAAPAPVVAPASRPVMRFLRDLVVIAVVAVLASLLIKTFLVRSFFIPTASMEHTLLGDPGHHDRILVDELVPRLLPLHRGDVIVFTDPGGWLPPAASAPPRAAVGDRLLSLVGLSTEDSDDHLVKRVIGLPGDHITCCDALGRLSVNGSPLDEPYVSLPVGTAAVSQVPIDAVVPAGELWVMGDNRWNSADSRFHGPVPIGDVTGRAFVVSWPVTRWTSLSDYPDTFSKVPAPTAAPSR